MTEQRQLMNSLVERSIACTERIAAGARPAPLDRLAERPATGRWSAAEVLEHLCLSDEAYEAPRLALIAAARPDAGAPFHEWTPTLAGRFLAAMLGGSRPLRAPGTLRPGPTPRGGVAEEFLRRQYAFTDLLARAETLDWRRLKMSSPLLSIIRLNLGDVFVIQVVHVERHATQIERALAGAT